MTSTRSVSVNAALWLALSASSAFAAPVSDASCLVTSGKDLGGERVLATEVQGANRQLPFAVGSLFVAKGAAIKLFSAADFTGSAYLLNGSELRKSVPTDGGVYLNAEDLASEYGVGTVGSFACTTAGEEAPISLSGDRGTEPTLAFYNDRVFELNGYRGNHATIKQVTLTNRDGKKLLSTHSLKYWGEGYDSTVDLDTGTVTITKIERTSQPSAPVVVTRQADGSSDLAYTGAISRVRDFVAVVANNREAASTVPFAPVPHLELQRVLAILEAQIEGL